MNLGITFAILSLLLVWGSVELIMGGNDGVAFVTIILALVCAAIAAVAFMPARLTKPQFTSDTCPMKGRTQHPEYPFGFKVKSIPVEWAAGGPMSPAVVIRSEYEARCELCGCNEPVSSPDSPHP